MNEETDHVQPKLEISSTGDAQEQQADEVSKKVSAGWDASAEMSKQVFSSVNVSKVEEEEGKLMAKGEDGGLKGTEQLQTTLDSSKGGGQSLDPRAQSDLGGKMGADLSDVKIHTDSRAHEMSAGINAKAFTHGNDIYFNSIKEADGKAWQQIKDLDEVIVEKKQDGEYIVLENIEVKSGSGGLAQVTESTNMLTNVVQTGKYGDKGARVYTMEEGQLKNDLTNKLNVSSLKSTAIARPTKEYGLSTKEMAKEIRTSKGIPPTK
jgi:hypothetical protein